MLNKKAIVTIILIALLSLFIVDLKVNGVEIFEDYFEGMVTENMQSNLDKLETLDHSYSNVTKQGDLTVRATDLEELKLNNNTGDIAIIANNNSNQVIINYKIELYANNMEVAEELINKVEVEIRKTGQELTIFNSYVEELRAVEEIKGVRVSYDIKAPAELLLDIENRYGELIVKGFDQDLKLGNHYGKFEVSDLKGNLDFDSSYSVGELKGIGGKLDLDADYSTLIIEDIDDELQINSRYGRIRAEEVGSRVEVDSRYTNIILDQIKGQISADLDYGSLEISDLNNNLDIFSKYNAVDINLSKLLTDYLVDAKAEKAHLNSNLPLKVKKVGDEKILSGQIGSGQVTIRVNSKYGGVNINQ